MGKNRNLVEKIKELIFEDKPEISIIILYIILAVFPLLFYFSLPFIYRIYFVIFCFVSIIALFIIVYKNAKEYGVSNKALKITSFVLLETSIVGSIFWINQFVRYDTESYNIHIIPLIIGAVTYLSISTFFGIKLLLHIKVVDYLAAQKEAREKAKEKAKEEAREASMKKLREDFTILSEATNDCLNLAGLAIKQLPSISNNFSALTNRVSSIENNFISIIKEHEEKNKKLMDALVQHTDKSTDNLENIKIEAVTFLKQENERAKDETNEIVSSMSNSLYNITTAIEESFTPFIESVQNLSLIDDKTSISIDRMAEAAETFVKISEPQAKLASEAAILIEESVANIRSIASRSLNILELELKNVIDNAVIKLQESSK